jgi:hypothetical protein
VKVEPEEFVIKAGEVKTVQVSLDIPAYTSLTSDQIELTFNWGREQQIINLTTFFVDKLDLLSSQYYIWQGYVNLGQSNLTLMDSKDFNGEIAINGQLGPKQNLNLYSSNQTWFSEFKYDQWDLKLGQFPLIWPGLVTGQFSQANFNLTNEIGDRYFALSRWDSADDFSDRYIWGAEAAIDNHSSFRYLFDPLPDNSQNIFEWHFQENPSSTIFWSNTLSIDTADPTSYGGSFQFASQKQTWQWNTAYQYIQNFYNVSNKSGFIDWRAFNYPS